MTVDMSQFHEVFFAETEELLAEAERLLLSLDMDNPDGEDLNAIFRAAHSIKGGAATFGFTDMAEITHVLENLLDKIRKNEMALTAEHVDAFLSAKDVLEMELDGHRNSTEVDEEQVSDVRAILNAMTEAKDMEVKPSPTVEGSIKESVTGPKAQSGAANGVTVFNVILPEVTAKDLSNLQEELSLLGDVTASKQGDGRHVIQLTSDSSEDDIISICSFILDPKDLIITTNAGDTEAKESVGVASELVTNQPQTKEDDEDFGLFINDEPANSVAKTPPTVETNQVHEEIEVDEDFGLFEEKDKESDGAVASEAGNKTETQVGPKTKPEFKVRKGVGRRESDKTNASETASIRVGVEKVDQLINLVSELVITQAIINQQVSALDSADHRPLIQSAAQLTRNTKDLQESVMSIRMMPVGFVFSRFPRMVRDLSKKLGKKIEFVTQGETTELDKSLIESIVDPLTHLIRNSVDHGVEMPEQRKAANKEETGKLTLSAKHKGSSIVIEVTDDGAGLDREKILKKAKAKGLEAREEMSDKEVFGLVFSPGFSTAEVVTDVSGRGVGMDVVKRNITAIGGSIEIRSALGFGTTMSISLPLTLAILDGMSISLGDNFYIIPLNLIVETMRPRMEDIKTITNKGLMVAIRGEYLPIISLSSLFHQNTEITHPTEGVLVVVEVEGEKAALFVDALIGQQQVVIKSLETNFKKVQGISSATIMADGSVALILDVSSIIKVSQGSNVEGVYA